MQSLFPVGGGNQNSNQPLYQFRAGKCQLTSQPNGKFLVSADLRRGNVQIVRGQDTLVHFRWANFSTGAVEDDRIIMPGDCVFKRVKTGRPDDRVYLLKFHYNSNSQNQLMFWMQNKDASKDEEVVGKVNELLNNPSAVAAAAAAANPAAAAGGAGGLGNLLGLGGAGGNQPDLMQLLGMNPRAAAALGGLGGLGGLGNPAAGGAANRAPAAAAAAAPAPAPAAPAAAFGGLDFSQLLNQMNNNPAAATTTTAASSSSAATAVNQTGAAAPRVSMEDFRRALGGASANAANRTPSLQDILTGEEIVRSGILEDPQVRQELISHLPPQQQTAEHLEATIRSPQLQQAITSLNEAVLPPDNFHNIATNFDLNPAAGTEALLRGDGVGAFLAAVQTAHPAQTASSTTTTNNSTNQEDKKEEDTKMEE